MPKMFRIDKGDAFTDSLTVVVLSTSLFSSAADVEVCFDDVVDVLGIFGMNRMTSRILMKDPNAATKAADCSLKWK